MITAIDGSAYTPASLLQYLRSLDANATVTLSVTRDGQSQDIQISASDFTNLFGGFGMNFGNGNQGNLPGNQGNFPGFQGFPLRPVAASALHLWQRSAGRDLPSD